MIHLNQRERQSAEFLKRFADALVAGETILYTRSDLFHLSKLGIDIRFIGKKQVKTLIKNKAEPYERLITDSQIRYLRGLKAREYLPFQVKALKAPKPTATGNTTNNSEG